ncbi:hypothetical protein LTS09_017290 [Friedmanniomyces endolithicus]|nr:hypothetical protein LTS09_017290 [Friedmanniomyces endolithicus]
MAMYDTPADLHAVFARVNRILFRRQLSNVELTLSTTLVKDTGFIGMTTAEPSGRVLVEIDVSKAIPHESLSQTILSTLLHDDRWVRDMGPNGHGDVWQSLAEAVERVANQELGMERRFQLGRREQVEEQLVRVMDDSDDST